MLGVRFRLFVLFVLTAAGGVGAQPATQPRVGLSSTTFTDRSPHSALETQNRRHHIAVTDSQRYELKDHAFQIYVPDTYDGERPYGLLVWVSPTPSGRPPQQWLGMLERHNLIWVGADDSGNDRGVAVRFGLALDAVHNLAQQYNIDDDRIYIAGFSGGGKVAAMLGVIYPDVFSGAIPMGGSAFYRNVPVPDQKNRFYPKLFDCPPKKMFELARDERRFVLLIGDQDFNYEPVKHKYEHGFLEDEFKRVALLVVPGLEHRLADENWFGRAIQALDEPLVVESRDVLAEAERLEGEGRFADAYRLYLKASMHGGDAFGERADDRIAAIFEKARLELVNARRAAEREQYAEAATILLRLRDAYGPAMPPEAEQLLHDLETNPASAAQIKAERDRERTERREVAAQTALLLIERDVRRAHAALRHVVEDFPDTPAAGEAAAEAERLWSDPILRAQIKIDPDEVEARKLLNLAENYRRNKLLPQARQRLETLIEKYPNTPSAAEARKMLAEMGKETGSGVR